MPLSKDTSGLEIKGASGSGIKSDTLLMLGLFLAVSVGGAGLWMANGSDVFAHMLTSLWMMCF